MAEITQQQVVDYIKGISVLELSQLVKTLESELGVSAAAAETPSSDSSVLTSWLSSRTLMPLMYSTTCCCVISAICLS